MCSSETLNYGFCYGHAGILALVGFGLENCYLLLLLKQGAYSIVKLS